MQYNQTPLHIAIENNNLKIVRLLLSNKNVDVNIPFILFKS